MPKKKGWRKSVSRRTDWRSRKTGKYDIESPERMPAKSPEMKQATSRERMPALNIEILKSNKLDKLAQKEKMQSNMKSIYKAIN